MRRALLLLAAVAACAAAQGSIPKCPGLSVRVKASRRTAAPGTRVRLSVDVKSSGPGLQVGKPPVNVRLSSAVAVGWKSMTGIVPARIEAGGVSWLSQEVGPKATRSFKARAQICAGAVAGSQTLAEAVVYRLNGTNSVECLTKASVLVRMCLRGIGWGMPPRLAL